MDDSTLDTRSKKGELVWVKVSDAETWLKWVGLFRRDQESEEGDGEREDTAIVSQSWEPATFKVWPRLGLGLG